MLRDHSRRMTCVLSGLRLRPSVAYPRSLILKHRTVFLAAMKLEQLLFLVFELLGELMQVPGDVLEQRCALLQDNHVCTEIVGSQGGMRSFC